MKVPVSGPEFSGASSVLTAETLNVLKSIQPILMESGLLEPYFRVIDVSLRDKISMWESHNYSEEELDEIVASHSDGDLVEDAQTRKFFSPQTTQAMARVFTESLTAETYVGVCLEDSWRPELADLDNRQSGLLTDGVYSLVKINLANGEVMPGTKVPVYRIDNRIRQTDEMGIAMNGDSLRSMSGIPGISLEQALLLPDLYQAEHATGWVPIEKFRASYEFQSEKVFDYLQFNIK
jgi:hypothetical protein